MKRQAPTMCPLCQDDVVYPVKLNCACKDSFYCYSCVQKWRCPVSPSWHEDAFIECGRATFAAPCPVCRTPLEVGMQGVVDYDDLHTEELVKLSVMCMAVTDRDLHEVFEVKPVTLWDDQLLALYGKTTNPKELDAIVHYVLSKNRPIELLKQVLNVESIDAVARFLKYVGLYPWSASLTDMVHAVMKDTVKWLTPEGVPHQSFCAFVASFAELMPKLAMGSFVPYVEPLVNVLRTTRQTGTVTMHESILSTLAGLDLREQDTLVAGVDAIDAIALYLDDDIVGHAAACILRRKRLNASILPGVHAMSCRRKYIHHTVALVNRIDILPQNETCGMILEQLLKYIKRPVQRAAPMLEAIQKLSVSNAAAICESLGDIMRLWMECPTVNMDETLDVVKNYMWAQRNYASERESDSD